MKTKLRLECGLTFVCIWFLLALPSGMAADSGRLAELRGVWQAHFNHDASRLVVRTRNGEVGLWDARKGTRISGDAALKKPSITSVISPDLRKFLVGFKDGGARVFDASSGSAISPVLDLTFREDVYSQAVFSPEGGTIVFFGEKEASVLDVKTGKRVATIPVPFELEESGPDSTASAMFAGGGSTCFVMEPQGTVTTYETKTWSPMGKPMKHPPAESAYQFGFEASPDGKWIVTFDSPGENGPQGQLQAWDALTQTPLGDPVSAQNGMSGRFLPGQSRVLVQGGRGDASVRDLPSMAIAYVIKQHDEVDGPKVEVAPTGKWLMAWGPDKRVELIDSATGKTLDTFYSSASVESALIPSDSSICYLGFENTAFSTVNLYDNYLHRFSVPELKITGSIRILASVSRQSLSPDGRWIMIVQGSDDQERIVLYDATSMKALDWSKP